ncbi:MAG: hypothetical protein IPK69_06020 [Phycisphaerales bacterium]|nr:MAG: hypothetical protein IPK69_06020 [Phycisphaerales bacterium]
MSTHILAQITVPQIQLVLQTITFMIFAIGLIYTGRQFRHWRDAAHVANFTKLVELQMQLRKMRVENPRLAKVYAHDVQPHQTNEEIQDYFMNLMQLSLFEIAWFGHKNHQLPDDYFASWVKRMEAIEAEDSFRHVEQPLDEDHARRLPAVRSGHDGTWRPPPLAERGLHGLITPLSLPPGVSGRLRGS